MTIFCAYEINDHTPNPDLEPVGEEEERPASHLLEARHGSRAEKKGTNWTGMARAAQKRVRW